MESQAGIEHLKGAPKLLTPPLTLADPDMGGRGRRGLPGGYREQVHRELGSTRDSSSSGGG